MRAKAARRLHRIPAGSNGIPRDVGMLHHIAPTYLLLHLVILSWRRSEGDDFVVLWAMTNRITGFLARLETSPGS
jgi:hypothetical protein